MRIRSRTSKAAIKALESGQLPPLTEDGIQAAIVVELRVRGFEVLVNSRRRKRCRKCGTVSAGGDGVSKGAPDLLVSAAWMPAWTWIGLEVKRPGRIVWSSPEQESMSRRLKVLVVQSVAEAIGIMEVLSNEVPTKLRDRSVEEPQ